MIDCQHLGKSFKTFKKDPGFWGSLKSFVRRESFANPAVEEFDLRIEPGEFVGLLGPNGAGKTTLMKMFTGLIVPSAGVLRVLGYEPFKREQAFRKRIALVMGQKSQLWWDIPALDSFLLLQRYYEVAEKEFRHRLDYLTELLEVQALLKVHVRKLSLGERMKMELIACLLHQPDIIFLDEPTIGLDLLAQKNIREFVAEYQQQHGTTVILTSHYMADVDALCERIVLIQSGRKHFDGPIDQFANILGREKFVSMYFSSPPDRESAIWNGLHPQWSETGTKVELRIAEERLRESTIAILKNFPVADFTTENMPIERVMKELISNPALLQGR